MLELGLSWGWLGAEAGAGGLAGARALELVLMLAGTALGFNLEAEMGLISMASRPHKDHKKAVF